ncbi:KAT8 regulatory NSL complex subunit 1-like protein isoform X2 [Rhea pennata]|uniref:KAT8 regulatory NSL complex subunit 1-like protein isoform X2 n=1 Tax=Rhea pennata TaxID=8795 RepID=UPI002E276E30
MTPALREAATKGHGIHLSPSLSSRAMESDTTLCMENSRAVEEAIREDPIARITCSVLGFPTAEPQDLRNDLLSGQHFGSPQSSKHYQSVLLMGTNSAFSNKSGKQRQSGEPDCSRMRNSLCNGADTSFGQISCSQPEQQVKGETFPEITSPNLAEMQRLLDSSVTESSGTEETQLLSGKWCKKNGFLGRALEVCAETKKGDLLHQILHRPSEGVVSCARDEVYARLLQCVTKQQMEISRAKRTQKRLQMLLAKHVIKHCDQQLKCFVKHQLQRMKVFHEPTTFSHSSSLSCNEGWPENSAATLEDSSNKDIQNGFCIAPGEIRGFALSAGGLLSRVEKDLDSDATCSSSDEDCDEQTARMTVEAYTSEWKWLADRARVGCRWTWLQAQISELEYKIQQLTDLHRQIRATKGMVILEEFPFPKDILKKQIQLTDQEALLNATGNSQAAIERQDSLPEHDFEMSPSSPTLLLRNIEKQSAQLSEIISSLIAPLNLSPASSPLSSKTCRHRQLVNGISFRASDSREVSSSSSWLLDHQHIKKRRRERTRLRSLSVTSVSTSARTRPLHSFQKRKLYRMPGTCYWSQQTLPSRDASLTCKTQLPYMAAGSPLGDSDGTASKILHYVQELDSSFHPVLSFPSDIPLHVYFETLLKKDDIKGEPVDAPSLGVEFKMSPDNDHNQHNVSLKQWSSGSLYNSKCQSVSGTSDQLSEGRKKRHLSETAVGEHNTRFETFSFQHAEPESHSSFAAVTSINALSRPTHSTSSQHNSRRRLRSESSYDIDNIVIPMSLVAPSKLEKLQYKEILTPSWRVVEFQPLERSHTDEEEIEDLSDEVFSLRHAKYEERERARWSLWEQSRWPRRNSRSYSKNADGRHSQDSAQKDHQGSSCASLHCAPEPVPDLTPDAHSSVCSGITQQCGEGQEAKSGLWELRIFPLKDEEVEALLCQDQVTNQTEMSSAALPSDALCTCTPTGLPDKGHLPKKQPTEEPEDCENVCLGITNTRKQR